MKRIGADKVILMFDGTSEVDKEYQGTDKIFEKPVLWDTFYENLAAGSVNGTYASDKRNVRTVSDPNLVLFLSGGKLFVNGIGRATVGNPYVYWNAVTRQKGLIFKTIISKVADSPIFGFDSDTSGNIFHKIVLSATGGSFRVGMNNVSQTTGFLTIDNTSYNLAVILRATGCFYFVKGGTYTNWWLIGIDYPSTLITLYPAISNYDANANYEYIKIPSELWLPTPVLSDGFSNITQSDGLGHAETTGLGSGGSGVVNLGGATWSLSGGKLINTPVLGSNIVVDGGFDDASKWTCSNANVSITGSKAVYNGAGVIYTNCYQNNNSIVINSWYSASFTLTRTSGTLQMALPYTTASFNANTNYVGSGRATSSVIQLTATSALFGGTVDSVVIKPLTLSELIRPYNLSTPNINFSAEITRPTATYQGGLVVNLDSASTPANFVLVYMYSSSIKIDKCVNGVYTNIRTTSFTYSAGARLTVVKSGTRYTVFYNNSLVGATDTIDIPGQNSNTLCGTFSTEASVSFDNLTAYVVGSEGQYTILEEF